MVRMVVRCAQKAGTATVACGTDQVTTMDVVRKKQTKESKTKQLLYSASLWCTQTHCALQHSPTFSKFHKHNTYNYDN